MKRLLPLCAAALLGLPASSWASPKASYLHYLKALLHTNQGEFGQALQEYEEALKLDPQSAFICQQSAELSLEMGRLDKALEMARRLVELSPENPQAHYLLGNIHWARSEPAEARAAFEKTLELKPDFHEALFALGNLLSIESPEKARRYLEDYLAQNPGNSAEAAYQLSLMEQRSGRLAEAASYLKRSIAQDPANLQSRIQLGQLYEMMRDTQSAVAEYREVLQRDPNNVSLLDHLGELLYAVDDAAGARELFEKAKALAPANATTCLWLALLAEGELKFDEAAQQIRESEALADDSSLHLRLSYYLTQGNRLKEAVEALEAAHKKWPDNTELSYFLALGYDDLQKPAKAVDLLQMVVRSQPEHRDARFQLGAMYEKTGDIRRAEEQFKELLRVYPQDAAALNYLGYSLADRGLKMDEAESLIRQAVALDPQNGAYADSLGWALFKRGRIEEALPQLRQAARLLPDDETIWDHVGDAFEAVGDSASAWNAWRTAQLWRSEKNAPGKTASAKKISKVEARMGPKELGGLNLAFLRDTRGELSSFGGPCTVEGEVVGSKFVFPGLVNYKTPWDLSVELVGPLFVPIFRASISGQEGFVMDPLRLEGVPDDVLRDSLYSGLVLLREYFDGSLFREDAALLRKGWRDAWVETPRGRFRFEKGQPRLAAVEPNASGGVSLEFADYLPVDGHWVPRRLALVGRGFSMRFIFSAPSIRFVPRPAQKAAQP
ncbi:MAG: tetratricopeptide repeat protein [Elusimicrobiota bacterium]